MKIIKENIFIVTGITSQPNIVASHSCTVSAKCNPMKKKFGNKSGEEYLCPPLIKKCRVGQEVKTPPFHGGITGSRPVRGTVKNIESLDSINYQGFFYVLGAGIGAG